jgi:hypothetical protein
MTPMHPSMLLMLRRPLPPSLPLQESKRIELQLRGRAGRQGDPGETLVLVSLEDPLIQQYAKDMGPMLQSIAAAFQAQDLATLDSERRAALPALLPAACCLLPAACC